MITTSGIVTPIAAVAPVLRPDFTAALLVVDPVEEEVEEDWIEGDDDVGVEDVDELIEDVDEVAVVMLKKWLLKLALWSVPLYRVR